MNNESTYIDKILAQFIPSGCWDVRTGASGMNNTTRFIDSEYGKYVLRIYQTHQDESKVDYEHNILMALKKTSLPFWTPVPVRTIGGGTIAKAEDGKIAALFKYAEGTSPSSLVVPLRLDSFGYVTGQLTYALEKVRLGQDPVYSPYYEIENTHPLCPIDDVIGFCSNPPCEFSKHASALMQIGIQLADLQRSIPELKKLPHQLIHGDLNVSNILSDVEGNVTAVLDFEFVTRDLRVMELAVCLSDLLNSDRNEASLWDDIHTFLTGYGKALKLTRDEINILPLLVQLRRLDVFIHFLGRYRDGINKIGVVEDQICNTASQTAWLTKNEDRLTSLCGQHVL